MSHWAAGGPLRGGVALAAGASPLQPDPDARQVAANSNNSRHGITIRQCSAGGSLTTPDRSGCPRRKEATEKAVLQMTRTERT